jgi:hypothetical protein
MNNITLARHPLSILVACEYSNIVSQAFRDRGHFVISCDLLPCDGLPDNHIIGDCLQVLQQFKPDMLIAFPPCTYLAKVQQWMVNRDPNRQSLQIDAFNFFLELYNQPIKYICIENPAGYPCTHFRHPDMIIHPFQFGDPYQKEICLWTKNLPPLIHGAMSPGRKHTSNHTNSRMSQELKSHIRSRFFPGIAQAMAAQWSDI